jgi:SHS2 domain-containing protein
LSRPPFRQLEHTSDLKVEVYGRDLTDLLVNAARCILESMLGECEIGGQRVEEVRLESGTRDEFFLDWLRELLYLFSVKGMVPGRVEVVSLRESGSFSVAARVLGEDYEPARHGLVMEIKAPTYHQFSLERTADGYTATVVFDV